MKVHVRRVGVGAVLLAAGGVLAGAVALGGCLDRPLKPLNPCLVSGVVADIAVTNIDKVDLLFMVDDSGSMKEEQESLKREFPKLINVLTTGQRDPKPPFPPAEDLHLGVVSSDMGLVGIQGIPGCDGLGDDGIMNNIPDATLTGCQATYPRFLTYLAGVNDSMQTANDFGCIASLGTGGCGFEQQLESALKALWPSVDIDAEGNVVEPNRILFLGDSMGFGQLGHGDTDNNGFLRNDPIMGISLIAVVMVTDEEDCSSADTRHFTPELYLDPANAADAELLKQDLNLRCFHNPQNLYKIERYVAGFQALRPEQKNLVIFAAIAGVPKDLVNPEAQAKVDFTDEAARNAYYNAILADPRMTEVPDPSRPPGEGNLTPSCNEPGRGVAFPPRRITQTVQQFGESGVLQSICEEDFGPALDAIIEAIAKQLGAVCLPRPLVRDSDGLVGCNVVWELPVAGTAPPGTPTACGDRPYLSEPAEGREKVTDAGGQVCAVTQIAVMNDVPAMGGDGWYYDDFSEDVARDCSAATPQRVAFTNAAKPETGVVVKLECLNEKQSLANSRTDIKSGCVYQGAIGNKCGEDQLIALPGDCPPVMVSAADACKVTLANGMAENKLFCHPELNLCVLKCATDADCPAAWVCDTRAETVGDGMTMGSGSPICVNPTCGDAK